MLIYQSKAKAPLSNWDNISISEMAATMQDMEAAGDPVTPENLKLRGYSSADVSKYGLDAARLAKKLSVKVVRA